MNQTLRNCLIFIVFLILIYNRANSENSVNKLKTISVYSCDSLVKANLKNPNFVILDVRTPSVWAEDHLQGSINRNYYDIDFDSQLAALPRNKIYLLHCQSGGRSGPTLLKMKSMGFVEVYEMSGGINAWKYASLPTTSVMSSKLMLVADDPKKGVSIHYGLGDTLRFSITNRGNDSLKFTSLTLPDGNEFTSDFDLKTILNGSQDYSFSLFYKPSQQSKDSLKVTIRSNGGDLSLGIYVNTNTTGVGPAVDLLKIDTYPNPSSGYLSFKSGSLSVFQELDLFSLSGNKICQEINFPSTSTLNLNGLPDGIYFLRIVSGEKQIMKKFVLTRL